MLRPCVGRVLPDTVHLSTFGTPSCLRQVSNAGMACVAAMTALRSLDIAGCSMVSEPGVAAVAGALTDLGELRVGGASRMSHIQDDAVAALAAATRLTSLDLSGCLNLSDAGLPFVRQQPNNFYPTHTRTTVSAAHLSTRTKRIRSTQCAAYTMA